jgi:hypothetical protein
LQNFRKFTKKKMSLVDTTTSPTPAKINLLSLPNGTNNSDTFLWNGTNWTVGAAITGGHPAIHQINDGTTSGPAYSFTSDTATGLYLKASHSPYLSANNTDVFGVTPTKVDILKAVSITDSTAFTPGDGTLGCLYKKSGSDGIFWKTSTTEYDLTNPLVTSVTYPLTGSAGSASAPTYSFSADATTGLYRVSAGVIGVSIASTLSGKFDASGLKLLDGTTAAPSLSFISSTGVGIKRSSANDSVAFVKASAITAEIGGDLLVNSIVRNAAGSNSAPSYTFTGNVNCGLYAAGANDVRLTAASTDILSVTSSTLKSFKPLTFVEGSAPSTPGDGTTGILYKKTGDDQLYWKTLGSGEQVAITSNPSYNSIILDSTSSTQLICRKSGNSGNVFVVDTSGSAVTITGSLNVSSNVVVSGSAQFVSNMVNLNSTNSSDITDVGIYGTYVSSGTKYAAIYRDSVDKKFKVGTTSVLPSNVVSSIVLGDFQAANLYGTVATSAQPNITTLANVTTLRSITSSALDYLVGTDQFLLTTSNVTHYSITSSTFVQTSTLNAASDITVNGVGFNNFYSQMQTLSATVAANSASISALPAGLSSLTSSEVTQLSNINSTTVSSATWAYLGALNQSVATGANVSFGQVNFTANASAARGPGTNDTLDIASSGTGAIRLMKTAVACFTINDSVVSNLVATFRLNASTPKINFLDSGSTIGYNINFNSVADALTITSTDSTGASTGTTYLTIKSNGNVIVGNLSASRYVKTASDSAFTTTATIPFTDISGTASGINSQVSTLVQNGTGISWVYSSGAGTLTPTVSLAAFTTDVLPEGSTNKYCSATNVRAQISGGVGITITSGSIATSVGLIQSGYYTPAFVGVSNVTSAVSNADAKYTREGRVVKITFSAAVTLTASTGAAGVVGSFTMSLPSNPALNPTFANTTDGRGHGAGYNTAYALCSAFAASTNGAATITVTLISNVAYSNATAVNVEGSVTYLVASATA